MKKVLVTGSAGLIGSEAVRFFCEKDFGVFGIDNDMRKVFFGEDASTEWNKKLLLNKYRNYCHFDIDIRDSEKIRDLLKENKFVLIVHTAAQPSHDWASQDPVTDFTVNANGTLILLENFRRYCPEAVFIFTSTNKVYGDRPNYLPLIEQEMRYELPEDHRYYKGIDESMSIDSCKHSLFGASKASADILVQEYGRYFSLKTVSFRGGCLTGPFHSGTRLHGFLSYLMKCCITGKSYTIYGYKGKQVRDNIHSHDLVSAFYQFYLNPGSGEVYNIGGSRFANISILEAIELCERISGKKLNVEYEPENRIGDHVWWISDISKFRRDYPDWDFKYNIEDMLIQIHKTQKEIP
jgi:CDP-paratose 2-epimerase